MSKLKPLISQMLIRFQAELLVTSIHVELSEDVSRLRDCLESLIPKLEAKEREWDE